MTDSTVEMHTSQANKELCVIEYPGLVQNVDKMIKTLGGIVDTSLVFSGEQKRLELKFQPDNKFCKLASGDPTSNNGILLKIKVRRSKRNPSAPPHCQVEVLGHCRKIYKFEYLADFQFLPIVKNKETNEAVYVHDEVLPKNVVDIDYFSKSTFGPLCIPYQFAKSDIVHTNLHRTDPKDDGQSDVLGVLTKHIYDSREVVSFSLTDPFPTHPDPAVAKRMKIKYVSDEQLQKVKKLFDEKPCWTRYGLIYESGLTQDKLKHITPSLAFFFSNGPWRSMYTRYGYDPRKDFNSRYYQTFDLRLQYHTGVSDFVPICQKFGTKINEWERTSVSTKKDPLLQEPDYPYLEEGKLPRARQWILRYCDLRLPKVQEMLDKIPTPLAGATCNEKTGWLPPGFDVTVRQVINNSFKETLREYYKKKKLQENSVEDEEYITDDNEPDKDSDEFDDVHEVDMDDNEMDDVKMEHMQVDYEGEL